MNDDSDNRSLSACTLRRYPEALGEDGGRNLLVLGHLGDELVVGGLVEQHRVVHLLLLLPLAPLLHTHTTQKQKKSENHL